MNIIKRNGSEAVFEKAKILTRALAGGGQGPPFFALRATNLPARCTAKRMVPDYISELPRSHSRRGSWF